MCELGEVLGLDTRYYRLSEYAPEREIEHCFKGLQNAYAYILGWHGVAMDLYEILGDPLHECVENVQVDYHEIKVCGKTKACSNMLNVPTVKVKVRDWQLVGRFVCEVIENESEHECHWTFKLREV